MAQFRAVIQEQRGQASRLGSKKSGIVAHINGWNGGVGVRAVHGENGKDHFLIFATSGSSYKATNILIGVVDENGNFKAEKEI